MNKFLTTFSSVLILFSFVTPALAADTLYFLHTDHLGSTRVVTDKSGTVVAKYDYYPYGAISYQLPPFAEASGGGPTTNSLPTERLYTSQISDESTDLYFYNARYYNPKTGNFISADTIEGPNRYAYVANNPINKTDPSGNFGSFFVGLGSVLSRAVGPVAFLAGAGLTAIGEVYKNIPLELIYGDTPPATVAQATRESGNIISNTGQTAMFGGTVSYLVGAGITEIGEYGISQEAKGLSNRKITALNWRWREKLAKKDIEILPCSPEGEEILRNAYDLDYGENVQSAGDLISSGATTPEGKIVVGLGNKGMPAWGETTTRIHELQHRTRIISGSFDWTPDGMAAEEVISMKAELRFSRMLNIKLPQWFIDDREMQIASGGYY